MGGQAEVAEQPEHLAARVAPGRERLGHEVIQLVVDLPERAADEIRHDKHRGRNALAFEDRQRVVIDVLIPVVERDCGHRLLERDAALVVRANLVERDELERLREAVEMPLEHRSAGEHARHLDARFRLEVFDHTVIPQHERPVGAPRERPRQTMVVRFGDRGSNHRLQVAAQPANALTRHGSPAW